MTQWGIAPWALCVPKVSASHKRLIGPETPAPVEGDANATGGMPAPAMNVKCNMMSGQAMVNPAEPPQAGGSSGTPNPDPGEGSGNPGDPDPGMDGSGDGMGMNGNNGGAARMETCEGRNIPVLNENAGAAGGFLLTGALETSDDFAGSCTGPMSLGFDTVVSFTAPEAGSWIFSTSGSDYDTVLYARSTCADTATELIATMIKPREDQLERWSVFKADAR